MKCGVVHLVDHLLPQRIGPALAARVRVFDDSRQVGVGQGYDESPRVGLDLLPACADRCEVGKLTRVQQRRRRGALPAREPDQLSGHDMDERLAYRAEAGATRRLELARRQKRRGVDDTRRRPFAVAVESPDEVGGHAERPEPRICRVSATAATRAHVPSSTTKGTNPIRYDAKPASDAPAKLSAVYG